MTDQTTEGTADAAPSEFEAFSAAFDKHQATIEETATEDLEILESEPEPQPEPKGRDERGRFVAAGGGEAEAAEPEGEAAEPDQEATDEAADADVPPPPAHLPGPVKEAWAALPGNVREAIAKQQSETDRRFGEVGQQMRVMKPIADRIINAAQQYEQFKGFSPDQIAEGAVRLAAVQVDLERDPLSTIMRIADHYGAREALAQALSGQQPDQGAQQSVALQQEISALKRQLADAANPDRVRDVISREFEEREIVRSVQEFASGKDLYPIVENYLPRFIELVKESRPDLTSPQAVLSEAYEMAVNAIPAAREKVRSATAPAAAPVADPKRAEAAKRAAAVNLKGRDGSKSRPRTEKEVFDELWSKHVGS